MRSHLGGTVQVDQREHCHSNDGEHEDEKHEEQTERSHSRSRIDQGLEDLIELGILFDEPEDTADSEGSQDGAHDLDVFADSEPAEAQNDKGGDHDGEIEEIPAIGEVVLLLSNYLHDGFNGEDGDEDVVDHLDDWLVRLWLHVPIESEDEGVANDTGEDKDVEGGMLRHNNHRVSYLAVSLGLEDFLGLGAMAEKLNFDPGALRLREQLVERKELLLRVESLNDHTDEELNEEEADNDHQDHRVDNDERTVVLDGLIVGSHSIDRVPHDIDPAFSRLDRQQGEQTIQGVVEVEVWLDPLATIVITVPHGFHILQLLLH